MIQVFFPLRGLDLPLMRLQDTVDDAFRKLFRLIPILDGVLLEDIAVTTTATDVNHGLGRAPRGYIVVKRGAATVVYNQTSSTPNLTLKLVSDGTDVVSLWVF